MHNLYKFHSYSDKFSSHNNLGSHIQSDGNKTYVELSMTFMQILPQSFEVPDFIYHPEKDAYFLMFSITFQFLVPDDNSTTKHTSPRSNIELKKFRFSIMGTDTQSNERINYSKYPLTYSFKNFIKEKYIDFVQKNHSFIFEQIIYNINENDHKKLLAGVQYLDIIFPNEKDIFIIDNIDADFYKGATSGLQEGIYIYEKSRTLNNMHILEQKLTLKETNLKSKTKKI